MTLHPDPQTGDADIAWLLGGPVRHVGWLQRGIFALRGSAVVVEGSAVGILGRPATGKSAVAAALALRGHPVLADSALPVELERGPVGWGTTDVLALWPAGARELGLDPDGGEVLRPGLIKRAHRFRPAEAAPLRAIAVLERRTNHGDPTAERMEGAAACTVVGQATAMAPLVEALGVAPAHFRWVTRLVTEVPVFHVKTDRHRDDLAAVASTVEALP